VQGGVVSVYSPKKATPTKNTTAPLRTLVAKELKQAKHESNKARRQRAKARHNDSLKKKLFDEKLLITDTDVQQAKKIQRKGSPLILQNREQKTSSSPPVSRSKQGPRTITITPQGKPTSTSKTGPELNTTAPSVPTDGVIETSNVRQVERRDLVSSIGSYTPPSSAQEANQANNNFTFLEVNYTSELEKWRFDLLRDEQERADENFHKQVKQLSHLLNATVLQREGRSLESRNKIIRGRNQFKA
jgi:hypothetical protein